MQKSAAIYARVSTNEQVESGFSIDEQRERLLAYCKAMNWQVSGVYVDGGYSGKDTNRPALQKMIAEIKLHNVVVVYKLDRLSRSQKDTLALIEDVFLENSIDFVSLQETLDTSSPFGRASIGILSAFAQLERETFKERSLLGRTGRARAGKWVGSGRPPIGYDYDPESQQLTINPYEAEQVKMVFELYMQGIGLQKIAAIMHEKGFTHQYGDWSWWGGIVTMLRNSVYAGKVTFDDKEFEGNHQAIIDYETFEKVQSMLAKRTTGQLYKRKSPFSHLLRCANCGAKMFYLHKKDRGPRYHCYSRYGKPLYMVKDKDCNMRIWLAEDINNLILGQIYELASSSKKILEITNRRDTPSRSNTTGMQKRISDIDKQTGKLLELYQFESIPVDELNNRIRALHEEKNKIIEFIKQADKIESAQKQSVSAVKKAASEIKKNWNTMELAQQIEAVSSLISAIVVNQDSIRIEWAFAR